MAEEEKHNQPSTSNKKRYVLREEERLNLIRDAIPPDLRPANIPEPLTNLSTLENERLTRLHRLARDGHNPPDELANLYFVDEMKKVLTQDNVQCVGHQFIRLSHDGRYGYLVGVSVFTKEQMTHDQSSFVLLTHPSTGDGRVLYGRYRCIDVAGLPPVTPEDHQYQGIPTTIKALHRNGELPCTAIVFQSFEEDLRELVREAASSSPNHSTPPPAETVPLPPSSEDHAAFSSPSENAPASGTEDSAVDDQVCKRTNTNVPDRPDQITQLDPSDSVAVGEGPESSHDRSQEQTKETIQQVAPQHNQVVHDPTEDPGAKGLGMKTSAPASSALTPATARPSTSTPVSSQRRSEDSSTAPRSRKGKERAQDPEEATTEVATIAKEGAKAKLRVQYDSSYASQLALSEARQSGLSQEQLEAMTGFNDPSSAAAGSDGDENPAGSSANHQQGNEINGEPSNTSNSEVRVPRLLPYVASPEQASSSALSQSQIPSNVGGRSTDDGQPPPPPREASPARTETGSNITYDDEVQDDGQDMGGTSAGHDPEPNGPTTPGPASGDKRKRKNTPSTGSEERPATKHRRPGLEAEDEPSPLPQSRVRNSRRDLISASGQPLRRWNTDPSLRSGPNLEARPMADGMPLRGLRTSNSIPEEEATEVAGSNVLSMATVHSSARSIAADRPSNTEDDERETEPQFNQIPIRVVIEDPRFLVQRTRESTGLPPTVGQDATTPAEDPLPQSSTSVLSDGTCVIKTTYLFRIINGSTSVEESEPTSSSDPPKPSRAEPSTTPISTPNQSPSTHHQVNRASQTDQEATSGQPPMGSSRPGIAHEHAPQFLGLLRAWRAAFMSLPDELLAEAGLRVTGGGTSTEETHVEQTAEGARSSQIHQEERYHTLLLSLLQHFRGALATLSPEILSALGLEITSCRSRSRTLLEPPPLRGGSDSGPQSGARPSLEASHPDTTDLGQVLAFLRDSLNHLSSAATGSTRPSNQGSSNFASNPPHVSHASNPGRRDRVTEIAGAEAEDSATNQSSAKSSNHPATTDAPGNPPQSDTVEPKTKRKDTKNKSKKGKNKEGSDPSTSSANPGPSEIATSNVLEDIEMTALDTRPPSPMDTEWDDNKSEAEGSGGRKGGKQDSAAPNNRDNGLPPNSTIQKQEHPEESNPAQPTTSSSSKGKHLKKKNDSKGTKGPSVAPAVRQGEASPTAAAPPETSPAPPTQSEPPADTPPQRVGTPIGQTASAPPTALPSNSRDEPMDIESPKRLPERDMNHGAQIPAEETFGEGPIVPDDEGPPPSSSRVDTSVTGENSAVPHPNPSQSQISGIGSAETAVDNATTNAPGDSWSESGLTEEYEDSRANPYRLRDVLHAAAAQDIMNELLPRSSRPSPQPSRDATQSIEANFGLTPTEQPDPRDGTPTPPRTTTPTAPSTVPAVVEQATPGTSVLPEQSAPAGAHDSNEISSPGSEGHHDEGSSHPGADATVQELVNAFGLWSLFYEATPSGTSRTNAPEES